MGKSEPFVCDICGTDVSGGNPFFTAEFEEFGLSNVRGKFCSMEHAVEWASSSPTLVPRKHPFRPEATKSNAVKGCLVYVALIFVLVCIVLRLIAIVRLVV